MTNVVFVVGMAGSGKSSLTAAYSEWLKEGEQDVMVANFDPGVKSLPYNPDIDARQYVDVEKLMLDYNLGPNGALIMASDLLADHLEEIRAEIEDASPDIIIADTPGQIELFAFREGGRFIARELSAEDRALIYLMDATFTRFPANFISAVYLAAAIRSRISQPQVYAITKTDLVGDEQVERIMDWATKPESFEDALTKMEEPNLSIVIRELSRAIFSTGLLSEPIPVSAKTNSGLVQLDAAVTRILSRGEKATT